MPAPSLRRRLDALLPRPARPLRRGLVLALAALLALAGLAAAIGFGLPGLRIVILGPGSTATPTATPTAAPPSSPGTSPTPTPAAPPTPTPRPTPAPIDTLGLGRPVDRSSVDAAAGYHVLLPTLPELGQPLGVYVRGTAPATLVSAAYAATPAIPAGSQAPVAGGTPVAILVMEFPGSSDAQYLVKMLPPGTTIAPVTVDGHAGYWIAGQPHELLYLAPNGDIENEPARLSSNVLAWNDGDADLPDRGCPGPGDGDADRGVAALKGGNRPTHGGVDVVIGAPTRRRQPPADGDHDDAPDPTDPDRRLSRSFRPSDRAWRSWPAWPSWRPPAAHRRGRRAAHPARRGRRPPPRRWPRPVRRTPRRPSHRRRRTPGWPSAGRARPDSR